MSHSTIQSQRGGTLLGFILGLVIGLTVALGVAMYVTKVPMPFSNKNLSRSAEQDAVEAQKNKDWNPNSAIQAKPAGAPEGTADVAAPANGAPSASSTPSAPAPAAPAVAADPLADLAKNKSLAGTAPGIRLVAGFDLMESITIHPSIPGIRMSVVTATGCSSLTRRMPSWPVDAVTTE